MHILCDTREKQGWDFSLYGVTTERTKLDCGDYTCVGLEDRAVIERKRHLGELYLNLGTNKAKARFYRELDKLKEIPYARIVCEFPQICLAEFPKNSGIPQKRWPQLRISQGRLHSLIHEVDEIIPIIYCNSPCEAEAYTYLFFQNIMGNFNEGSVFTPV